MTISTNGAVTGVIQADQAAWLASSVSGGVGAALSAVPQAIMSRGLMGSFTKFNASGSTFTYHTTTTVEQMATRFRIWLPNMDTAAVVVGGVKIAVSNAMGANPTVGGTGAARYTPSTNNWVSVTFGGATSVTLPAAINTAAGSMQPSWTPSDWIDLTTIARTDGGTLPVIMLRALINSGNNYNLTTYPVSVWQDEANTAVHAGRMWTSYRYTGDGITTPTNFVLTTDLAVTGSFFARFEYQGVSPGFTFAVSGDSIADGAVNGAGGNYGNGWAWQAVKAVRALRTDLPIELCLLSFSSTNTSSFMPRTCKFVADGTHFDAMICSPHSPNDGTPNQSTVNASIKYWQQMSELMRDGAYSNLPPVTVTVGASPYAYRVQTPGDLIVSGGTLSSIVVTRSGSSITMPTAGAFSVQSDDVVTITYTVAPTVTLAPSGRPISPRPLILSTPCPNTSLAWDATADGFRLQLKAAIVGAKKAGVRVADFDAALSDGATPARYASGMTTDGLHPNETGHAAAAVKAAAEMAAILPTALA